MNAKPTIRHDYEVTVSQANNWQPDGAPIEVRAKDSADAIKQARREMSDRGYTRHDGPFTYKAKRVVKEDVSELALYSFNFNGAGINAVWAITEAEAVKKAKEEFPTFANQIHAKSFRRLETKAEQDNYWKSLPLMD